MIEENLDYIRTTIPKNVQLVAVSKTKANELILRAYDTGQRIFGENRVQELVDKYESLPKDIEWHMIGHLQTNKVKYIAPFVNLIHGVDSLKLLKEINKQAAKNNRSIQILFQFHIATESTKFGFNLAEIEAVLTSDAYKGFANIEPVGVMGMATFTSDQRQVREEFKSLKDIFTELKHKFFQEVDSFKEISMGMSGDYQIAIEQGSTMVRVGSSIFGSRT